MSVNHALDYVDEMGVGLDAVEFCRFNQRADDRPPLAATVAAREQMIFSSERDWMDCTLDRMGVEFDANVIEKARQNFPARERVANGFGERTAPGYLRKLRFEPFAKGFELLDNAEEVLITTGDIDEPKSAFPT
jgi:hypothetical protein